MNPREKKKNLADYLSRVTQIPTFPKMVVSILERSNDPDVEMDEIADIILKDKVLTARMIRLVNSAFWGIRREIVSIREAIVYLGLRQIRNIVLTISLFNLFHSRNPDFRVVTIWEHGLGCAMISRIIAELVGYTDLEKTYLAGLLHDIGEVILSQFYLKEFDEVIELVQKEKVSFYEAEKKIIGIDHTDFGPWFMTKWGFSEDLAEVITTHHTPEKAKINPKLISIVVLADLFCRLRGLDYGYYEVLKISLRDEFAWRTLAENNPHLDRMDLERFTFNLDGMVDEVKKVVREVYRDS